MLVHGAPASTVLFSMVKDVMLTLILFGARLVNAAAAQCTGHVSRRFWSSGWRSTPTAVLYAGQTDRSSLGKPPQKAHGADDQGRVGWGWLIY